MIPDSVNNFFDSLAIAKENGLEYEFVLSFFNDLGLTDERLNEAMDAGLFEWDMA